ncbi:MAG: hypothetical protein K9K65_07565 [Desulfarculaceae bacterium]|nr:hypothetical protein [Desulfarculaceae bacterium]MCF8048049.1 hypothetical protein [Desulfarculaceae bacterium]MCF8097685.1 hypothetical protein [Desulfarculaceae bacterium]MCF8123715.1 hypothetical protein [Desulfarculaceae bacterium]
MTRFLLWCSLLLLAALLGAAPAAAQYAPGKPDSGLDEMRYRAIYGRPPPPAEEQDKKVDQTSQGETTTTEAPKPRYRFSNDPLLNPPGRRAPDTVSPAASAPGEAPPVSPYPQAPGLPPGRGYTNQFPPGMEPPSQEASSAPPMREIRVLVVDDQGKPVPQAQVNLSTRQRPFFREGFTDEQGSFTASVPCYLPGNQPMLAHRLRVTSASGSMERMVVTRQGTCGIAAQVSVILADPNRLDKMMRRYRDRQELYEQEEEAQKAKEEKELEELPAKGKGKGKTKGKTGAKKAP